MRRDRISRLAERRSDYTGEKYARARAELRPDQSPLPAAHGHQQRNFEADIFHAVLEAHGRLTETSFGIRTVHPRPDTLELEVESEQRAEDLLHQLLPLHERGVDEIHGLAGLRITKRTNRGIELHVSGHQTSVWLSGLSQDAWKRAEQAVLHGLQDGWQPLWNRSYAWTAAENAHDLLWNTDQWTDRMHRGAWLSSGLLRRLPMFHRTTPAQTMTGWLGLGVMGYDGAGPVRWVFEIDYAQGMPHLSNRLIAALTDREFGLPIAPALHLESSQGAVLPPNIVRLDDAERTGLIELRLSTGMQDSFVRQHPEIAERIRERTQRFRLDLHREA